MQHRAGDKPAYTEPSGVQQWWRFGKLHRDDDKPAVIWANGGQEWWRNGKRYYPSRNA
jgi:hypothetical protein